MAGFFESVITRLAPQWAASRARARAEIDEVARQERMRNHAEKQYGTLIDSEMRDILSQIRNHSPFDYSLSGSNIDKSRVEESLSAIQNIGSPWYLEMAGLTLDEAWKRGFPDYVDYVDAAKLAHNEHLRTGIMKLSRHLESQHPHAKAIIETRINFVVGPNAWDIMPEPKVVGDSAKIPVVECLKRRGVEGYEIVKDVETGKRTVVREEAPPDVNLKSREIDSDAVDFVGNKIPGVNPELDGPRRPYRDTTSSLNRDLAKVVKKNWYGWMKRGRMHPTLGWVGFWSEAYRRYLRDGEVFIYYGTSREDASLAPRFLDPQDFVSPDGDKAKNDPQNMKSNGVEVDPKDKANVVGYWYRPHDEPTRKAQFIPASKIEHIKHGVDSTVKRGVPMIFVARHFLKHFDTWLQQSLRHQKVQSLVAILRQWDTAPESDVNTILGQKDITRYERRTPVGNTITHRTAGEFMPVVDAPMGMKMTYTQPNGGFRDSNILARRVLLACAVGSGLSEAMVTGDGSNANYASTRITNLIPIRGFEREQGEWGEVVKRMYERWWHAEAAAGRLPVAIDDEMTESVVTPSAMPNFEGEVVTPSIVAQYQSGLLDKKTARERLGEDPEVIAEREGDEKRLQGGDEDPIERLFANWSNDYLDEEPYENEDGGINFRSTPAVRQMVMSSIAKRNGSVNRQEPADRK